MIYGYARVSTKGQARDGNSLEAQTSILTEAGAEKIYYDSYTGTTTDRPEFDKLKDILAPRDKLLITKLDRFARTVAQGSSLIESLIEKGVTVHVLNIVSWTTLLPGDSYETSCSVLQSLSVT